MTVFYGRKAYRVTADKISSVTNVNGTIISQGDINEGYEITFQHDTAGCGAADSGLFVAIKDFIPWTNISMEFYLTGTASCWSFNNGGYVGSAGNSGTGYLLSYNSSLDVISKAVNSFELPQYTKQMNACDNASTNFMHSSYYTGAFRKFSITRRRDSSGNLAGPCTGRSCNSTGAGSWTTIRNIYVWN